MSAVGIIASTAARPNVEASDDPRPTSYVLVSCRECELQQQAPAGFACASAEGEVGRIQMTEPPPTSRTPVDTGKVAERRMLRFESIDQAMAEVERLAQADRDGRLKQLGNWTLGQTLGHLAAWTEYAYTGVPLKPPFFIRWILRLRKHKFLYEPMQSGVKIPRVEGGTLATDPVPLDEGLDRFRRAMKRLKAEAPTAPSPILGHLTHEESIALTLRHAELHLGFLIPD